MTGYTFALDCTRCAGPLAHVTGSPGGTQAVAVAQCAACGVEYTVTVHLRVLRTQAQERAAKRARAARAMVDA